MKWITALKVAIAESNVDKISMLLDEEPTLNDVKEMKEALFLIKEASKLVNSLQEENKKVLIKLSKHIEFVKSTKGSFSSKFNTSH